MASPASSTAATSLKNDRQRRLSGRDNPGFFSGYRSENEYSINNASLSQQQQPPPAPAMWKTSAPKGHYNVIGYARSKNISGPDLNGSEDIGKLFVMASCLLVLQPTNHVFQILGESLSRPSRMGYKIASIICQESAIYHSILIRHGYGNSLKSKIPPNFTEHVKFVMQANLSFLHTSNDKVSPKKIVLGRQAMF